MSSPAAALVARGLEHHRRNELDLAAEAYARALELAPEDADALHLAGVLAQQRGAAAEGVALISRAVAIRPEPRFLSNLANACNQLGRFEAGEAAARRARDGDPASPAALCNLGVALRGLGRLDEAAENFRAALVRQPGFADALANLGVVETERGDPGAGAELLRQALALNPQAAEAWLNLGNACARLDRSDEAEAAFRRAAALKPGHVQALANLGALLKAQGRLDESLAAYAEAAKANPRVAVVHHRLGLLLGEMKQAEAAVAALERAAALAPDDVAAAMDLGNALYAWGKSRGDASGLPVIDRAIAAHRRAVEIGPQFAPTHYNLGLALLEYGLLDAAVAAFERALALDPDYAEAYCNLGHCLSELGRYEPAAAACERALALKPDLAEAQSTLGNIHVGRHRLADAEAAFRRALALRPDLAGGYCNLGVALVRQGRGAEALQAYDAALRLDPDMADAHWNRALVLLQQGDFAAGWPEYEWRLRRARRIRSDLELTQPIWGGEPLEGRRILLHAEQGLGDAIQCARFVPLVAARGGTVVLRAPRALTRLFAGLPGIAEIAADDTPLPEAELRSPLFSLPRLFAPTLQQLSWPALERSGRPGAYLAADPAASARWRQRLDQLVPAGRLRVGVVWSGNRASEVELGRSIPLRAFEPVAARAGVQLISLQKGDGLEELDDLPPGMALMRLGPDYDAGDFADTAAVIEALDLVISCDTSVAHLAGALGKPVWLAIAATGDWRWLSGRADSPWYPSLGVYRQAVAGDWEGVMRTMAAGLPGERP